MLKPGKFNEPDIDPAFLFVKQHRTQIWHHSRYVSSEALTGHVREYRITEAWSKAFADSMELVAKNLAYHETEKS